MVSVEQAIRIRCADPCIRGLETLTQWFARQKNNLAPEKLADGRIYIMINIRKIGLRRMLGKSNAQTCDYAIGLQNSFQLFQKFFRIKADCVKIAYRMIQDNNVITSFRQANVISKITDKNAGSAIRRYEFVFIAIKEGTGNSIDGYCLLSFRIRPAGGTRALISNGPKLRWALSTSPVKSCF